jgi:hypothetical protein
MPFPRVPYNQEIGEQAWQEFFRQLKELVEGGSPLLDDIGSTRGSILYRGASGWVILTPGTVDYPLVSNGAGADPAYEILAVAGGGTGVTTSTGTVAVVLSTGPTIVSPVITTSPTANGATWTDLGTVTTADINGGTVDGTTVGATTAAAGTFTSLNVSGGNATLNSSGSALATDATAGFTYIPSCAGTPIGTPASLPTGAVPIVWDSANEILYVYSGGSWKGGTNPGVFT